MRWSSSAYMPATTRTQSWSRMVRWGKSGGPPNRGGAAEVAEVVDIEAEVVVAVVDVED